MTVKPGYGGQTFMEEVLPKVARLRQAVLNHSIDIQVWVCGAGFEMGVALSS